MKLAVEILPEAGMRLAMAAAVVVAAELNRIDSYNSSQENNVIPNWPPLAT